jgi:hypothetical protein
LEPPGVEKPAAVIQEKLPAICRHLREGLGLVKDRKRFSPFLRSATVVLHQSGTLFLIVTPDDGGPSST